MEWNELDRRVQMSVDALASMPSWKALTAPGGTVLPQAILRELYLGLYSYHRHVYQAATAIVGRLRLVDRTIHDALSQHLAEEAGHGEMALRAHVALGGDEVTARRDRIRPVPFAIASFWWGLDRLEDPFCYLGAMYLFESSTPTLYETVLPILNRLGVSPAGKKHADEHSTVDKRHVSILRGCIKRANRVKGACLAILYGLDAFTAVYPIPLFEEAFAMAASRRTIRGTLNK